MLFAIPDHPWYLDGGMAAVRIAMTVGVAGKVDGDLFKVVNNQRSAAHGGDALLPPERGKIQANLTIGVDLDRAKVLRSNESLAFRGICLVGRDFLVGLATAKELGLGNRLGLDDHIRPYTNGRDITAQNRGMFAIDMYGLSEHEIRSIFPEIFQWLYTRVKLAREANRGKTKDSTEYADTWWEFAKPRSEFRQAVHNQRRYLATVMTAKHRFFTFLGKENLPDQGLVTFALDDAFFLGVLSSRIHVSWALAAGGRLGIGNDPRYNQSRCFDPFPFPNAAEAERKAIRDLAEEAGCAS